jgi:hypothetical protein
VLLQTKPFAKTAKSPCANSAADPSLPATHLHLEMELNVETAKKISDDLSQPNSFMFS